jgi:hypothetical protein
LKPFIILLLFACSMAASADTIRGAVQNGTTNKPSAGDEVLLKRIGQGMEDVGKTKTNAKGEFTFDAPASPRPYLIWVKHQDVTYTALVTPGSGGVVAVPVFVANPTEKEISISEHMMVLQASNNTLKVDEIYRVDNASNPPRTLNGPHTLELYLPEGASITDSGAQTPGSMPLKSAVVPQTEKNKYAFLYPIRPGETQFKIGYTLPYTGKLKIAPKFTAPVNSFLVVTPLSMNLTPADASSYQPTSDPQIKGVNLFVAKNTKPQQQLGFEIAGSGEIPRDTEQASGPAPGGAARAENNGPGGGLGVPNEKPDPLHSGQWYFLAVLTLFLGAGAVYVFTTTPKETIATGGAAAVKTSDRQSLLMEAMKEEVFQLESDRIRGKISQPEYQSAKAALDKTLQRAVQREAMSGTK